MEVLHLSLSLVGVARDPVDAVIAPVQKGEMGGMKEGGGHHCPLLGIGRFLFKRENGKMMEKVFFLYYVLLL